MKGIRYTDEIKAEALKQMTERGHSAVEVARRLGITDKSLYRWKAEAEKQLKQPDSEAVASLKLEIAKLNKALKRATEAREILKKAAVYFANHPEWSTNSSKHTTSILRSLQCVRCWMSIEVVITHGVAIQTLPVHEITQCC